MPHGEPSAPGPLAGEPPSLVLPGLRRAIRFSGLTAREVARRATLSESGVSRLVRENRGASRAVAQRLADALGVDLSVLTAGRPRAPRPTGEAVRAAKRRAGSLGGQRIAARLGRAGFVAMGRRGGITLRDRTAGDPEYFRRLGRAGAAALKARVGDGAAEHFRALGRRGGAPAHRDPEAVRRAGRNGGRAVKERYGPEHYRRIPAGNTRARGPRLPGLRAAREAAGLTRRQLAARAAVGAESGRAWEEGRCGTRDGAKIARLAAALGVPVERLLRADAGPPSATGAAPPPTA